MSHFYLKFLSAFSVLCLLNNVYTSPITYDINENWSFRNLSSNVTLPSTVPGGIYTDLLNNKIIKDPYYDSNDVDYKWISLEDWSFSSNFKVSKDILSKKRTNLVFEGLDTVALVSLNETVLGNPSNMFVRYVYNVTKYLKETDNNLTINFVSAVNYAEEMHNNQLKNYLIPPDCPLPEQHGACHVNYIRKIQSSFSWDWGPSFPSQGIWKPVYLEAFDSVIIRDALISPELQLQNQPQNWIIKIKLHFESAYLSKVNGTLLVQIDAVPLVNQNISLEFDNELTGNFSLDVQIPESFPIKKWWPNGYGNQPLYNVTLRFTDDVYNETVEKVKRIGFRTIELDQTALDKGHTFSLMVNGIPIFAKGSNWIPADSFPERITKEYLTTLLKSAKEANMNMLRVWGGGMYEQDSFYDLADEMGILLWHDMMFACSLYPSYSNFLELVSTEIKQQVRRLKHHPSIALWAGNNENEQGLAQNWWPVVKNNFTTYKKDYKRLYISTIMKIVADEDATRPFLASSPSNGILSKSEDWVANNPQDLYNGDVHNYQYNINTWSWVNYPIPRFASEYGYQSYPSFEAFKDVAPPDAWNSYRFNNFTGHRQHHPLGDLQIEMIISHQFMLPNETCKSIPDTFEDFFYLSQISQAMSIKTETEHYRRWKSSLNEDGKGFTMGALYWQLNDIWQAPSWSSIEFGGKWKMLHYYAKEFFSPILVSPYLDQGILRVIVVSDVPTYFPKLTLNVLIYNWTSFVPSYNASYDFEMPPLMTVEAWNFNFDVLLYNANCTSQTACFLQFQLSDTFGKKLSYPNTLFPSPFSSSEYITDANVTVSKVTDKGSKTFDIQLKADAISPFVWLEAQGIKGHFSKNGFLAVSNVTSLEFYSESDVKEKDLQASLKVRSLSTVCFNELTPSGQSINKIYKLLLNQEV